MLPWFLCAVSVLGQSKGVFCWFQILMWGRHLGCDLYIKGGFLKFSVSKVRFLSGLLILQLKRYPRHLLSTHITKLLAEAKVGTSPTMSFSAPGLFGILQIQHVQDK